MLGAEHLSVLEPGQLPHGPVDDGGPAAQHALPPLVPRESAGPRPVPEAGLDGDFTACGQQEKEDQSLSSLLLKRFNKRKAIGERENVVFIERTRRTGSGGNLTNGKSPLTCLIIRGNW